MGVFLNAIAVEVAVLLPLLFITIVPLALVTANGPLMLREARAFVRPGPGRHRRNRCFRCAVQGVQR